MIMNTTRKWPYTMKYNLTQEELYNLIDDAYLNGYLDGQEASIEYGNIPDIIIDLEDI